MIVHLEVSQYLGYPHYYGRLAAEENGKLVHHDIERTLTAGQAKTLNIRTLGPDYRAGQTTTRFDYEEQLVEAAIALFQETYPESGAILLKGNYASAGPDPVLVGPDELKTEVQKLLDRADEIDWWDGDNGKEMDRLMYRFIDLVAPYKDDQQT